VSRPGGVQVSALCWHLSGWRGAIFGLAQFRHKSLSREREKLAEIPENTGMLVPSSRFNTFSLLMYSFNLPI
jgi:hypothetical protein